MKVITQVGSKDRFLEMFQRVNKINLSEDYGVETTNGENLPTEIFNDLQDGQLKINQINTKEIGDNENEIELVCSGEKGSPIIFNFNVIGRESDQEGVFEISQVKLVRFRIKTGNSGVGMIDMLADDNTIVKLNVEHGQIMKDVVGKYTDFSNEQPSVDEEYDKAIQLIDKVPYKNGSEKIQTQANYFDQKPTNPSVRVNNLELQKFVKEEDLFDDESEQDVDSMDLPPDYDEKDMSVDDDDDEPDYNDPNYKEPETNEPEDVVSQEERDLYSQAYENLITRNRSTRNSNYSPTHYEIENEVKKLRPVVSNTNDIEPSSVGNAMAKGKKRVYPAWADKFLTENDIDVSNVITNTYNKLLSPERKKEIITRAAEILDKKLGVKKFQMPKEMYLNLVKHLALAIFHSGQQDMNEGDYPKELEMPKEIKTSTRYPKPKKKHRDKKLSVKTGVNEDDEIIGSIEYSDLIPGGLGQGKRPQDFDPEQIKMGLGVEMEHSDDPMYAIEIVLDHLTEDPEYYTQKETPEASAQANASAEASGEYTQDYNSDKELTDELLGYKSINVGDNVDEEIVGSNGAISAVGGTSTSNNNNTGTSDDNLEYKKYTDYSKRDFNTLPDNDKEEYFDLWKKYKPKNNV